VYINHTVVTAFNVAQTSPSIQALYRLAAVTFLLENGDNQIFNGQAVLWPLTPIDRFGFKENCLEREGEKNGLNPVSKRAASSLIIVSALRVVRATILQASSASIGIV